MTRNPPQIRGLAKLALAAALACPYADAAEAVRSVEVIPQRDYGIVMGEVLVSEIRVAVAAGFRLETASLPAAGSAVSDFLELREATWQAQQQAGQTVYRIRLDYQVFKGVREAETVEVPALPLRFSRGPETVEAKAPAWQFTLTPLIPARTADEDVAVRGDLPPPEPSASGHWRWLAACLAGLAGLWAYAAWQLGWLPFRSKAPPFARAASGLKRLRKQPDGERWRQGVKLIHAALDETAGHSLFAGQLPKFLEAHPRYAGLAAELERFFALSDRLFFAGNLEIPADYPWQRLEKLCRQLAAAGRA